MRSTSASDSTGSTPAPRSSTPHGKVQFPHLEAVPGLYRMTLKLGNATQIYIGETSNLYRRLAINYRNPGPTQSTNIRINAVLTEHLRDGATVDLATTSTATVVIGEADPRPLDLSNKASRLLAENAALLAIASTAEILNL
jgi:hypothetical protein